MSLIDLSHRMIQNFNAVLKETIHMPEFTFSSDGIDLYIIKTIAPGNGIVVCAVGSISLPVPPDNVFELLRETEREVSNKGGVTKWKTYCQELMILDHMKF